MRGALVEVTPSGAEDRPRVERSVREYSHTAETSEEDGVAMATFDNTDHRADVLLRSELFKGLKRNQLGAALDFSRLSVHEKGERIFRLGEPANSMLPTSSAHHLPAHTRRGTV